MRDCMTCKYTAPAIDNQGKINFALKVCKRFPPSPIPIMTAQGQQLGVAHPTVGKGVFCYEWAEKEEPETSQ